MGVANALNGVRASGSCGVIYYECQLLNLMRREILLERGPNKANVVRGDVQCRCDQDRQCAEKAIGWPTSGALANVVKLRLVMRATVVEKPSREIPAVVLPVRRDKSPQKEEQQDDGRAKTCRTCVREVMGGSGEGIVGIEEKMAWVAAGRSRRTWGEGEKKGGMCGRAELHALSEVEGSGEVTSAGEMFLFISGHVWMGQN